MPHARSAVDGPSPALRQAPTLPSAPFQVPCATCSGRTRSRRSVCPGPWPAGAGCGQSGRAGGAAGTLSSLSPQNGRSVSKRGVSCQFGPDVTKAFLEENNLDYIIRSHEVKAEGYEVAHGGRCVTVFSAPNYWYVPACPTHLGLSSPPTGGFLFLTFCDRKFQGYIRVDKIV